jgi:multicomponent Na+:H+ antiporter subunit B
MILLRKQKEEKADELELYSSLSHDNIVRMSAYLIIPLVFVFGVYVLMNGHLSPGGGFSGGAVLGASIILMSVAYGKEASARFMSERVFKTVSALALSFYCLSKAYSFFCGANHLESIISPGTPGRIFSAGLILPLNIAVGFVVTCTMYGIYRLFKEGKI